MKQLSEKQIEMIDEEIYQQSSHMELIGCTPSDLVKLLKEQIRLIEVLVNTGNSDYKTRKIFIELTASAAFGIELHSKQ